jgi:hypothetical protein
VGEKWPQEAVLERGRVGHRPTEKLRQKKKKVTFFQVAYVNRIYLDPW